MKSINMEGVRELTDAELEMVTAGGQGGLPAGSGAIIGASIGAAVASGPGAVVGAAVGTVAEAFWNFIKTKI